MKRTNLLLAATLALPLCVLAQDKNAPDNAGKQTPENTGKQAADNAANAAKHAPDNTGKNERDRDNRTLTPGDQSERPEDLKVTQSIRQALMKDKALSTTAKNIKIITAGNRVTLRGPVNTAEEKTKIQDLVKGAAGQMPVDNQLEIKAAR